MTEVRSRGDWRRSGEQSPIRGDDGRKCSQECARVIGIIRRDPESYLANDPSWRPTLPSHQPDIFKIRDLVAPAC